MELSWWMKIRLWALTQYRRIVYLDADVLVNRPLDELFALPDEVLLAAPVHVSADGKGGEMSVGVMSLRPDLDVYQALTTFMKYAAPRLQTGVRSVDQLLQQTFFGRYFTFKGYPRWEPSTGMFSGCRDEQPYLHAGANLGEGELLEAPRIARPGIVCALPPQYDFCVTYPALVAAGPTDKSGPNVELQDELAVMFAPGRPRLGLPEHLRRGTWREALQAKLLHWTGPRRKPWLHWLSLARTPFDDLWWQAHADLCAGAGAEGGADGRRQPCRIACAGATSPLQGPAAPGR